MVRIAIKAKVKETGEFIKHKISVDDMVYDLSNDSLYEFIDDFLVKRHGDIFKWFRFWTF